MKWLILAGIVLVCVLVLFLAFLLICRKSIGEHINNRF
jgi:Tfp pilus assembly protein PilN